MISEPHVPWKWLHVDFICASNAEQIAGKGWLDGVRDKSALESALARSEHLAHYGSPDVADLAAAYAFGIARNHPFVDGNKRVAWTAAITFLYDNGYRFLLNESDAIRTMQGLAAGEVSEEAFARWLRERIKRIG